MVLQKSFRKLCLSLFRVCKTEKYEKWRRRTWFGIRDVVYSNSISVLFPTPTLCKMVNSSNLQNIRWTHHWNDINTTLWIHFWIICWSVRKSVGNHVDNSISSQNMQTFSQIEWFIRLSLSSIRRSWNLFRLISLMTTCVEWNRQNLPGHQVYREYTHFVVFNKPTSIDDEYNERDVTFFMLLWDWKCRLDWVFVECPRLECSFSHFSGALVDFTISFVRVCFGYRSGGAFVCVIM